MSRHHSFLCCPPAFHKLTKMVGKTVQVVNRPSMFPTSGRPSIPLGLKMVREILLKPTQLKKEMSIATEKLFFRREEEWHVIGANPSISFKRGKRVVGFPICRHKNFIKYRSSQGELTVRPCISSSHRRIYLRAMLAMAALNLLMCG